MKRKLTEELRELYRIGPPPDPAQITALLARARGKAFTPQRESSLRWFIKTQIRFISWRFLAFQLALICLYGFFTAVILRDNAGFLLLVPAAPIAVMLGTGELSRSFRYKMSEMELPSRFSLPQVLLARLTITVVIHAMSLTFMLCLTAMKTYRTFAPLILYGLAPSFLAAAGSLFLINRARGAGSFYFASAYCIALSAVGAVSLSEWPEWYSGAATAVWLLVLAIGAGAFAEEAYRLIRNCSRHLERAGF